MIELRPIFPEHHPMLYHLATTGTNAFRWRYRGQIPPFEVFVQQLHQDVLMQFVVWDNDHHQPAGHVVAYAADLRNRLCYVGVVVEQSYIGTGIGAESLAAMVGKVFAVWDLRKIYAEVPEFTFAALQAKMADLPASDTIFEVEGCLTDYLYSEGRYWDMYYVAVTRDNWYSTFGNAQPQ